MLVGCGRRGQIVMPEGAISEVAWDAAAREEIGKVELKRTQWASYHLIRLAGAEKPHVHQRHDAAITLITGHVRLHLGQETYEMKAGDVAYIPHGLEHWAENLVRSGASEAYVVFTPPFDGKDTVPVNPPNP